MTDTKDARVAHNEDVSGSDADIAEKAGRSSIAGGHAESLAALEDPDAGKTAEERAAIVRICDVRTLMTQTLTTLRTRDS
jgi:hypothetical protein